MQIFDSVTSSPTLPIAFVQAGALSAKTLAPEPEGGAPAPEGGATAANRPIPPASNHDYA